MASFHIIEVTPKNVYEETLFCIKDVKNQGFMSKKKWFDKRYDEGLRIKILKNDEGKALGFIEYVPVEKVWRPVEANQYMFIHCMYIYSRHDRDKGLGTQLIKECEQDALRQKMLGVVTMTSSGSWIADKRLFDKNGFKEVDQLGRFELMAKKFKNNVSGLTPKLIDWTLAQQKYKGWNLVYANQCPWHEKAVSVIMETALKMGIQLSITEITSPEEAKQAPSGFGVFTLLRDGRVLEDHYISKTRFENIVRKELNI